MKNIRLLPVVVVAALALLSFKVMGLVTSGGYVLTGTSIVLAAGGGHGSSAPPIDHGSAPGEDPTLVDTDPTLTDTAPTLQAPSNGHGASASAHGEEEGEAHGAAAGSHDSPHPEAPPEDRGSAGAAGHAEAGGSHGGEEEALLIDPCAPTNLPTEETNGASAATGGTFQRIPPGCPLPEESTPVQYIGGESVPLTDEAQASEHALVERLGDRREELNAYAEDLNMRAALVEAAEARLEERTQALAETEARINALVEERKAFEEGQFSGIVSMYETMRPQDAAVIFDTLEMPVLLRIARSMNPRKMAPILARMTPERAQALTSGLANLEPSIDDPQNASNNAQLPQIVGQ